MCVFKEIRVPRGHFSMIFELLKLKQYKKTYWASRSFGAGRVPPVEIEDYGHAVEETIVTNISKMHINEHTFAHVFNPYDRV
jgi:hypothetical protein